MVPVTTVPFTPGDAPGHLAQPPMARAANTPAAKRGGFMTWPAFALAFRSFSMSSIDPVRRGGHELVRRPRRSTAPRGRPARRAPFPRCAEVVTAGGAEAVGTSASTLDGRPDRNAR